ncbi:hypothetical protein AB0D83_27980 [Streptomyces decoyicus]|uniref:hypothetical protein n=1 Tax=Streptomyces decoyicus TaxID=249567 RepID=UPI0033C44F4B
MGEILEQSELLGEWQITKCEVELHPEIAQQSLDAADGPGVPPADPAARAAQYAQARAEAATAGKLANKEVEAMRVKVRRALVSVGSTVSFQRSFAVTQPVA